MSEVEWETQLASAVLLIRVTGKDSSVTEDGRWIVSDVRATVLEVPKETTVNFSIGQTIMFGESGGEVWVGTKVVKASLQWAKAFRVNSDYLVFVHIPPDGSIVISPANACEEDQGDLRLKSMINRPGFPSRGIASRPPGVVLSEIRAAAQRTGKPF